MTLAQSIIRAIFPRCYGYIPTKQQLLHLVNQHFPGLSVDQVLSLQNPNDRLTRLKDEGLITSEEWAFLYSGPNFHPIREDNFSPELLSVLNRDLFPHHRNDGLGAPNARWPDPNYLQPTDHNREHELVRIREFRNRMGHSTTLRVPLTQFNTEWMEMKTSIRNLTDNQYTEIMEQRKTGAMDSTSAALTLEKMCEMITETQQSREEVNQQTENVRKELQAVKHSLAFASKGKTCTTHLSIKK